MALNLAEHSRNIKDPMEAGIVKSWLDHFPFMSALNVKKMTGLRTDWRVEDRLPDVGFRSVNEAFLESTGTTEQRSTTMSILGGLIDIDHILLEDETRMDEAAQQMDMKARALGYKLANEIINGDLSADPEGFDGLKVLSAELTTRFSRNTIDAAGLDLSTGANREANADTFLDYMHQLVQRAVSGAGRKPSFFLGNDSLWLHFTSMMRRAGHFAITKDAYNREVESFMGIPFYDAGYAADQTTKLIADDHDGSGRTSIYGVVSGDEHVSFLNWGAMKKKEIGLTENGVWNRWMVEQVVGLRAKGNFDIVRLKGLDITA